MPRTIEDHSPCEYEQHRDAPLLLSFDEFSELEHHDWIRESTPEEIEKEEEKIKERGDLDTLKRDKSGRPYLWVTVLKTAPGHIWRQATGYLRLFRFMEDA